MFCIFMHVYIILGITGVAINLLICNVVHLFISAHIPPQAVQFTMLF